MSQVLSTSASAYVLVAGFTTTIIGLVRIFFKIYTSQKALKEQVSEHQVLLEALLRNTTPNGGNTNSNGDIVLRTERKVDLLIKSLAKAGIVKGL